MDGVYVVKQWKQPVFAYRKGESWLAEPGCEKDVFTVCAFYGRCILFDDAHVYSDAAPKDQEAKRWWAAKIKGAQLCKKYAGMDASAKMAKLTAMTKHSTTKITFSRRSVATFYG